MNKINKEKSIGFISQSATGRLIDMSKILIWPSSLVRRHNFHPIAYIICFEILRQNVSVLKYCKFDYVLSVPQYKYDVAVLQNLELVAPYVISGFRHEVDENCALLRYYVGSSGNFFPSFRDNLSVPSSRVKDPSGLGFLTLQDWTFLLSFPFFLTESYHITLFYTFV